MCTPFLSHAAPSPARPDSSYPFLPVPPHSSKKAVNVRRLALVAERPDMIIEEARNTGCTATLLPAASAAVSLAVCSHDPVNINFHPQTGQNIPEEGGASTITTNRAGTVTRTVEVPASSIVVADLTMAGSLVVDVVKEDELPRRHDGDEESGEECELHGEILAGFG